MSTRRTIARLKTKTENLLLLSVRHFFSKQKDLSQRCAHERTWCALVSPLCAATSYDGIYPLQSFDCSENGKHGLFEIVARTGP